MYRAAIAGVIVLNAAFGFFSMAARLASETPARTIASYWFGCMGIVALVFGITILVQGDGKVPRFWE